MSAESGNILADVKEKFGEDAAEEYVRLTRALRSLVNTWTLYVEAPNDSELESMAEASFAMMTEALKEKPDHTMAIVEALLALILHMRNGGTYEAYFEAVGISPIPEEEK